MESERMADIIQEMRMARTEFPFAYEIGRKDEPEEFDADGLMVKPRSIVIEKVTIEALADRIEKAWEREKRQARKQKARRRMAEKTSRKDLAFARFAAANPGCKGKRQATEFEVQASFAMGICNHWQYLKLEENDKRWDEVCNAKTEA